MGTTSNHEIPELDRKGLREFGLVTGAIVAVLFGLFLPWLLEHRLPLWPWVVLAVLGVWALVAPMTLRGVYRVWMRFGLLLSKVTTPLIMGTIFFVVIAPVGFLMKLGKRDPMRRGFDRSTTSYRVPSERRTPDNLEKPF
jgi:hypothetical protein